MKNRLKNKWVAMIGVLIIGIIIGKIISPTSNTKVVDENSHQHDGESIKQIIWTCAMHPQIRMNKPGKCPICSMELIPVDDHQQGEADPNEVSMTSEAMALAEIHIMKVEKSKPEKEIRLLGKIRPDERLLRTQVAHLPGRIEKLYVNFTGKNVLKGQKIAQIYSPELVTAQKELFESIKSKQTYPELYQAVKNKLKLWKLTEKQIEDIANKGEIIENLDILADYSGTVMKRNVELGDYVKEGSSLFEMANLTQMWVMFEAYETDLPWINTNDKISFTVQGEGNKLYNGKISYIDPFVDTKTRITKIRVEISNPQLKLLPEMYAKGIIKAELKGINNEIVIPKSAVLWTGKRAVVYVKVPHREMTSFLYREIILGEDVGDFYVVKTGLEEGEEIAVNGVFRIDASAQLSSKKSMMNPEGGKSAVGGMAGMKMDGDDSKNDKKEMDMSNMEKKKSGNIDQTKIPIKFKEQLGDVLESYLNLKDKLVSDNSNIKTEVKNMKSSILDVDMNLVTEDAHNAWMKALKSITKDLELLTKSESIDEQRNIFLTISKSLSDVTIQLGVKMNGNKMVYLDFCPMANDNKGGYWMSTEKEIKNPYFGIKMNTCGEIKSIIKQ